VGSTNYVSISLAVAMQRSLDVTAHNLANSNTSGFKASHPLFESFFDNEAGTGPDAAANYVQDKGDYVDFSQGALTRTDGKLDLALSGSGWFAYQTDGGQISFGRDGRLSISSAGDLETLGGAQILGSDGSPISVPANAADQISIARDGTITSLEGAIIGEIGVFTPPASTQLLPAGNGLYLPKSNGAAALIPSEGFVVAQGFVEESNVRPILEMTRMIEVQRAYERAINLMNEENELTRQAIRRLGQIA
jgi:flagellar basal-body rod protein FlgF